MTLAASYEMYFNNDSDLLIIWNKGLEEMHVFVLLTVDAPVLFYDYLLLDFKGTKRRMDAVKQIVRLPRISTHHVDL